MPINALPKNTPRGRGPEPMFTVNTKTISSSKTEQDKSKEADLAAQEAQELWESQEIGITSWSGETGTRYSDPH